MKNQILLLSALCLSAAAIAQSADRQVIGSSGGSYSGASIQADYTVGEAATVSGSSGTFSVSQGFQQNPSNTSSIKENSVLVDYSLFPNPAKELISLSLNSSKTFDLKVTMTNAVGQSLLVDEQSEKISGTYKRDFPIQTLASGVYFINLFDEQNKLLQSIRFMKQ